MSRRRVHVLYEYGPDLRPHGSAFIRLLRPLTHPALSSNLEVTHGLRYEGQKVDAVIVDRFWQPRITLALAEGLVRGVRQAGAQLIYALDDNFLDLPAEGPNALSEATRQVVQFFLSEANGVWVTTRILRERLGDLNRHVVVIPHALDERLLVGGGLSPVGSPFGPKPKVIGYMGTFTHDEDLMMVLPALQAVAQRHRGEIEFQLVGVVGQPDTIQALQTLPVRMLAPRPGETEYPLFMLWFSSRLHWDIGISPLKDSPFTQCKSDIKYLDYSAIGAAGIYSRVPAYTSSVRHLETGWLAENTVEAWVEALETSLADDALRQQLGYNATRYLYTQRILAWRAHAWLEALDALLNR